jgi:putative copper resistance protein D
VLRLAALVAAAMAVGWLLLEAASMGGVWADAVSGAVIRAVMRQTEFGHLWMPRLAIAALVCVIAALTHRPSVPLALASAALLGSLALTGHAVMNAGTLGWAHPLNQAVHLLAAGFWLGGLVPLGLLLAQPQAAERAPAVRALRRFSNAASTAVVLVLASGIANAWMMVGRPSALFGSIYGRTLIAKLVLVAVLLALALVNRLRLFPALAGGTEAAAVRIERNVKIELALGAAVIAAAMVLGNLPPPITR